MVVYVYVNCTETSGDVSVHSPYTSHLSKHIVWQLLRDHSVTSVELMHANIQHPG